MTAFERTSGPVLSETARGPAITSRKHFGDHVAARESDWQPRQVENDMYITTAMGGGVNSDDVHEARHHENGMRKFSSKKMVKPVFEQQGRDARLRAAAAPRPADVNDVDRRIKAFAGSLVL